MTTSSRKPPARRAAKPALTFADVRAKIQRPRQIVDMVLDAEAAAEIGALEQLLERAQRHDEANGAETARDVAKHLQEVEEQAEASRVRFALEAITHRAYQALRAEHPPTKEQIETAARRGGNEEPAFDPDAFAPALVEAQLVEPKPETPEEFAAFWDDLSDGQLGQLWQAAISVQFQTGELGPPSQAAADILRSFGMATG
jgi:integrase